MGPEIVIQMIVMCQSSRSVWDDVPYRARESKFEQNKILTDFGWEVSNCTKVTLVVGMLHYEKSASGCLKESI